MKHIKLFENFEDEHDIDLIVDNYIEALIWTQEGVGEDADGNDPMDGKNISDINKESKEEIKKEVEWFINSAGDVFEELSDDQIGHDLWLTRNGHGSGFFERIEEKENLEIIEELCDILGNAEVFVNDDGEIYHESNDRYKTFNLKEYRKEKEFDKTVKKFNL